jgi:hypothetical protein
LPETALIELDPLQLNFLSRVKVGNFSFRIAGLTLQPDIPSTRFFSIRSIRQFLAHNSNLTNEKLSAAQGIARHRAGAG